MHPVNQQSLALTVDAVNDAFFRNEKISVGERQEVARFIASRQGLPGAYGAFLFAPIEDYKDCTLELFTGEAQIRGGGAVHILGQEACRTLKLLNVNETKVRMAIELAETGMYPRLYPDDTANGYYCCASCTSAIIRNLTTRLDTSAQEWIIVAFERIKACRDNNGRWRQYPFYYTLLAISELPDEIAADELQYAAPACERLLKRSMSGRQVERRRILLERVLARV